jgi:ubiquinone/menaquinone biosynthesis C-methylase UbiE
MSATAQQYQKKYYEQTSLNYDEMHTSCETDEHYTALQFINLLSDRYKLGSFLDVGAGTGRGVSFFLNQKKNVLGVEPVRALIEQAETRGVPKGLIVEGTGYSLPFADASFDAVFECGVLHHVAEPSSIVGEMIRVAKKAVFLSDSNRFGQGSYASRLLKLGLYKCGMWRAARYVQTGGKMFALSEGDGLFYSYSVFDSYSQLGAWAGTILLVPTGRSSATMSWLHPLITAPSVLLCAIKNTEVL